MSKGFLKSLPELDLNNMEDMKLLLKSYIDEMIKLFNFPSKLEYEIIVFEKEYFSIDITSENEKYNATIKRIYD